MPPKIKLQNFEYIDPKSADYNAKKNTQIISFMESLVVPEFNFQSLSYERFRELIDSVHNIICSVEDMEDRTWWSIRFIPDYDLVSGLNSAKVGNTDKLLALKMIQLSHYNACGFDEKARALKLIDYQIMRTSFRIKAGLKYYGAARLYEACAQGNISELLNDPVLQNLDEFHISLRQMSVLKNLGLLGNVKNSAVLKAYIESAPRNEPDVVDPDHEILLCALTMNDVFDDLRSTLLPLAHMFVSPRQIENEFRQLFEELREDFREKKSVFYIAAKLHCRYIDIHPKIGSTKRVARVLMNLVLMAGGETPVVCNNELEIDAYHYAMQESVFHRIAQDQEKHQYAANAFEEFIRNKCTMELTPFYQWMFERHQVSTQNRAYQIALRFYKTPEKLSAAIETCLACNQQDRPKMFAELLAYAQRRLAQPHTKVICKTPTMQFELELTTTTSLKCTPRKAVASTSSSPEPTYGLQRGFLASKPAAPAPDVQAGQACSSGWSPAKSH